VTVNPPITATISNDTTVCNGQSVTLTASGGTNYSWSTGATTSSINDMPASTTLYYVFVSNGSCTDSVASLVTVYGIPAGGISADTSICQGQNITLTVSGGTTYAWSTGETTTSITVSPSGTTTYSVVASNGSCVDSATVQVAVASPFTTAISNDTTLCQGPTIVLTVSGGNQYLWSNGNTTSSISVTPSTTTTYSVVTSNGGCFDTASVLVTVNQTPNITISKDTTICRYQTMVFSASGGTSYLWSTGATANHIIVNPAVTTTYSVTVSNGTCSATAQVMATVNNVVGASITGSSTICAGHGTTLNATGAGAIYYYWITGDTTQSITVGPSITTQYWVWVSNGTCIDTARFTVNVIPSPTVAAGTDTTINIGESATLTSSGGPSYNWTPVTGLSCTTCPNPTASPTNTTTYVVTVTYGNGCSNSSMVTVTVVDNCGDVFVPSAFSPNADGENDILKVRGNCIKTMSFIIYDRWGEKVFESTDPKIGWDGTYNGKSLNSAVFVYYLNAGLFTGKAVTMKGNINLIK
jgi:gliding motility-associated-like protein